MERRKLNPGQEVLIIYNENGFTEDAAVFVKYSLENVKGSICRIPIFKSGEKTVSGIDCFWVPVENVSPNKIQLLQYELISVQLKAIEVAEELGFKVPLKIKDRKLEKMAQENVSKLDAAIKRLGFDPRDDSWIEEHLADGDLEKKWFVFERENGLIFSEKWDDIVNTFNKNNNFNISIEQAKNMSKKRMRYILGAFHCRTSGDPVKEHWKEAAKAFEKKHRDRENRMLSWTLARKGSFPLVKVKKNIRFFTGPFHTVISEKIPHIFTDKSFSWIKEGIILRVLSFDPQDRYIRLDFTEEIRKLIHKKEDREPWVKDTSDYDMWIKPEEIETHLEMLEPF